MKHVEQATGTTVGERRTGVQKKDGGVGRREFLKYTGLGAAALASISAGLWTPWTSGISEAAGDFSSCSPNAFFDDLHSFQTLGCMTEQFIPGAQNGEPDPGAFEACLVSFLGLVAFDPNTKTFFQGGVAALDGVSNQEKGADFKDLNFMDQTEVLAGVQMGGNPFLESFFSTVLLLTKVAWFNNFPENAYRDDSGQPIITDVRHLITDPNTPETNSGWDVLGIHPISWETEKLMWEWQAGIRVVSLNGLPEPVDGPLSTNQRMNARRKLVELSDEGLV